MVKQIFIFILGVTLLSFTPLGRKDTQRELIIHCENLSDKAISQTQTTLSNIPGIQFVDYCEKHKVFMLKYDVAVYANSDLAIKTITNASPDLKPVEMLGNSIESISNDCNR